MEKKKSYQELLKEYTMTQIQKETSELETQIDLFLKGILKKRQEKKLRLDIDRALDSKDKESFCSLSKELSILLSE
ncbi:IDEAL domain-containing protein [Bacillus sp. FSL K6-3431]|uniref:IDEAL domain-containing protein n=1 Tax=Bacillus sp. FSL K6-3431 TaxID=2921500 RepID=UPI0030FBD891